MTTNQPSMLFIIVSSKIGQSMLKSINILLTAKLEKRIVCIGMYLTASTSRCASKMIPQPNVSKMLSSTFLVKPRNRCHPFLSWVLTLGDQLVFLYYKISLYFANENKKMRARYLSLQPYDILSIFLLPFKLLLLLSRTINEKDSY